MAKRTKADVRREALREELWPSSESRIWKGPREKGYWCAPRILPLLLYLAREKAIVGAPDCSAVYLELLSRDFGQGIVEILDEDEHAFCAGYVGSRARRTWQERIRALEAAGFLETMPKGNRKYGYVLLLHPAIVVAGLREKGKIGDSWWHMYQRRLREVGAPVHAEKKPGLRVIKGKRSGSRAQQK